MNKLIIRISLLLSELYFRITTAGLPSLHSQSLGSLVSDSLRDRPDIVPQKTCNNGLIGQFVEIPRYTSADMSKPL